MLSYNILTSTLWFSEMKVLCVRLKGSDQSSEMATETDRLTRLPLVPFRKTDEVVIEVRSLSWMTFEMMSHRPNSYIDTHSLLLYNGAIECLRPHKNYFNLVLPFTLLLFWVREPTIVPIMSGSNVGHSWRSFQRIQKDMVDFRAALTTMQKQFDQDQKVG